MKLRSFQIYNLNFANVIEDRIVKILTMPRMRDLLNTFIIFIYTHLNLLDLSIFKLLYEYLKKKE